MRSRRLALAVIVTALSGCDNVTWGGADVRLEGPPERDAAPPVAADSSAPSFAPPEGPLLLAGRREGDMATLAVVGVLGGGDVQALPPHDDPAAYAAFLAETVLAPGSGLVAFSGGVRVGRVVVEDVVVDSLRCDAPAVRGHVEMVPASARAERLIALSGDAAPVPYGTFRTWSHTYDQRVGSLNLASAAIPRVGAPWPPSLLEARADVQALRLPEDPGPSVAATFLFQDRLAVAPPAGRQAYSLFVMGTERDGAIRPAYTWFRRDADEGKGAPLYFDHLDWDGDGSSEILLEVLGETNRWFAGLDRRSGALTRIFEDGCGGDAPPAG